MKYETVNIIIAGESHSPVTVSIDSIKALKPIERVVMAEDSPEKMPKLPSNNTIRAGSQK